MRIGFIGLGIMGKPMAINLLKKGYELMVNDHHLNNIDTCISHGAVSGTLQEIAKQCDVIITMLPNSPQVKEVMLSEDIMSHLHEGQIYIDTSSIDPSESVNVYNVIREKGVEMLDAPVSGGEPKAIDGTLSFMVGGREEVFEYCKPILSAMGSSVVRIGEVGTGNVAKLANQIIVAVNIAALAEGLMFAKMAGADPGTVYEAIKGGLAGSTVMNAKAPMMLSNDTKPGFRIDLHIKDLNNAINNAHQNGSPLLLSSEVMEMLQQVRVSGFGKADHSALSKFYEMMTGTQLSEQEKCRLKS